MSTLVVSGNLPLLLRYKTALLFTANSNLDKTLVNIFLLDKLPILFSCTDSCLIHQVLQIRTSKACSCSCDLMQIDIIRQRLVSDMDTKDLLTSLNIWSADHNLTVKTSRSQNRWIKNIHTVCRRKHNDTFVRTETIHLNKHLVQCLLTLIMTATKTRATLSGNRINLIDKHDTWCILLCILKQITHTARTNTDEHLDEIRTGNREERNTSFSGNCLCKQCLTCSRRSL